MSKSLGRGLSSLIPNTKQQQAVPHLSSSGDKEVTTWLKKGNREIIEVSPSKISANPHQPRQHFSKESLADLVSSIQIHGILQPLIVTETNSGGYELVAGERRLRAAQSLRLKTVPVIVRLASELEKLELSLIENIQRQDLNPLERAEAYRKLIDEFSLTHERAAQRLGKARPVISNHLRLLELPDEIKQYIRSGQLSETLALMVLEAENKEDQKSFARKIIDEKLTKRDAKHILHVSGLRRHGVKKSHGDPLLKRFEQELSSKLSTRVKIGRRGKTGWIIEIEAYSKEELEGIIGRMV